MVAVVACAAVPTAADPTGRGCPAPTRRVEQDTVVLLHGLGRSPRSLKRIERELFKHGYRVVNVAYPTGRESIEGLSARLGAVLARQAIGRTGRVHFVTHSMGGIVLRYYLHGHRIDQMGRVVMLSPPNAGSELVDLLKGIPWVGDHAGPSREQLGTDASSLPSRLGPVGFELGVIAGNRSWNPLFSWVLPGEDDGMVSVERAKVGGMSDFLVVSRTHTFLMNDREVIRQTLAFLRDGRFDHSADEKAAP